MRMEIGTIGHRFSGMFDTENEVYSTRMAFVFCLGISALLWWIPVLGPAVAGYVCGRKTGSMTKGFVCSFITGALLLLFMWGLSGLILGHGGYPDVPADTAAASLSGIVGVVASYLKVFFTDGTSSLDLMGLGVVAVFGGVGGILSRQARKEAAFLIATGATEGSIRPAARSVRLYSVNKAMGFEAFDDCIATQRMMTNENKDADRGRNGSEEEKVKTKEGRPVATTVQTVTTTVSGKTVATQSRDPKNPFSDILDRNLREKNG